GRAAGERRGKVHPAPSSRADSGLRGAGRPARTPDGRWHGLPRLERRRLRRPQDGDRHPVSREARRPCAVARRGAGGLSPTVVTLADAEARAALLELGGRESTGIASAIEALPS